jgi:hypothetical protein
LPASLLSNHDPAVIGEPDQAPLLQGRQEHLHLLQGLLILLDLGVCLSELLLKLLFTRLVLLFAVLILGNQSLQLARLIRLQ